MPQVSSQCASSLIQGRWQVLGQQVNVGAGAGSDKLHNQPLFCSRNSPPHHPWPPQQQNQHIFLLKQPGWRLQCCSWTWMAHFVWGGRNKGVRSSRWIFAGRSLVHRRLRLDSHQQAGEMKDSLTQLSRANRLSVLSG